MVARSPQRIRLTPERRAALVAAVQAHFLDEFDTALSDFRAETLVDFFVQHLGPPVYNQGVHDAAGYVHEKLADIEGDIHEPDEPR